MFVSKGVLAGVIFALNAHNAAQIGVGTTMALLETRDVMTNPQTDSNGTLLTDLGVCIGLVASNPRYTVYDRYDFWRSAVRLAVCDPALRHE